MRRSIAAACTCLLGAATAFKSSVTRQTHSSLEAHARRDFLKTSSSLILLPASFFSGPRPRNAAATEETSAAVYAYRSGGLASLRPLGLAKLYTRYEGYVEAPKNYGRSTLPIRFDFPTDWLAIDKLGGGIQYVDQRNGNKLYVLRASLPEGSNLKTVNKSWFSDAVLSPEGDVVRSGVTVEGGRTSFSRMISDCTAEDAPTPCTYRRRLTIKYDTVTGSGVQTVERRGLLDAWQVNDEAYLMLATATAVKFDKKGMERDTLEAIVDSFMVGEGALS